MLLAIANSGRTKPLHMFGPANLEHVVRGLMVIVPDLEYEIVFHEIRQKDFSFEYNGLTIRSMPLSHRCPCLGYSFAIRRAGKFDPERAKALGLPVKCWGILQKSGEVEFEGRTYTAEQVMGAERKGLKVTFCTDTRPVERIADFARGSDIFVCEGIYGSDDMADKAAKYKHMMFSDAARLAKAADVGELWLTHFSPSMVEPSYFLKNALKVFDRSVLGYDRLTKELLFEE
jgi:ribonuclease Z